MVLTRKEGRILAVQEGSLAADPVLAAVAGLFAGPVPATVAAPVSAYRPVPVTRPTARRTRTVRSTAGRSRDQSREHKPVWRRLTVLLCVFAVLAGIAGSVLSVSFGPSVMVVVAAFVAVVGGNLLAAELLGRRALPRRERVRR